MIVIERFGKSIEGVVQHKKHFFSENDKLLARTLRIAEAYASQPLRQTCKNCAASLQPETSADSFSQHGVHYRFCQACGHCLGDREETPAFLRALYSDDGGAAYGSVYAEEQVEAYMDRVRAVYAPKVEFWLDALSRISVDPLSLDYADLGAGSGYLVKALRDAGVRSAVGFDVSEYQSAFAEKMVGANAVSCHRVEDVLDVVASLSADAVSMVGFIEHVQDPRALLAALRENQRVRFLLVTFPLFSPTVSVEHVFDRVFPRHLAGGHTHLYTLRSLSWLEREQGLEPIGKWWFGGDALDLFRSISVTAATQASPMPAEMLHELWFSLIDDLQLVLDRSRRCSSVHAVYRIRR